MFVFQLPIGVYPTAPGQKPRDTRGLRGGPCRARGACVISTYSWGGAGCRAAPRPRDCLCEYHAEQQARYGGEQHSKDEHLHFFHTSCRVTHPRRYLPPRRSCRRKTSCRQSPSCRCRRSCRQSCCQSPSCRRSPSCCRRTSSR